MSTETTSVTIIMPIRNEAAFIERSLSAVLAQDYPADELEILVVDGISDDGTQDIVRRMLNDHPRARLLENPRRLAASALNVGVEAARGEVIVRVDGHTIIAPNYVRRCVEVLSETGADCVGGSIRTISTNATARAIALAMGSRFGVGDARFRTTHNKPMWVDTLAFGAYGRQVFDSVGQFHEDVGCNEDDEFNYRLLKGGGRIWLDPSIESVYYCRPTPSTLFRQYFRYGFWKVRVFQKVPGSSRFRHWVPPLFALYMAGGLLVAILLPGLRLAYLAGLLVYFVANLAVSIRIAARAGWRQIVRLPIVFAILHLSYGLGFWAGVLRFGPPWQRAMTVEPEG